MGKKKTNEIVEKDIIEDETPEEEVKSRQE